MTPQLCLAKQTLGSEGAAPENTCAEICVVHFKINGAPPSLIVSISKTVTVIKNDSQGFHLCNKWGCGFKRVMHWPSPTPTPAIYGRAPSDASRSKIRVVGNCFENQMEKISEPHLLSLFPLSSHIHTLLPVSLAVVKWCTNWFCMDKTTLREMCCHNLIKIILRSEWTFK